MKSRSILLAIAIFSFGLFIAFATRLTDSFKAQSNQATVDASITAQTTTVSLETNAVSIVVDQQLSLAAFRRAVAADANVLVALKPSQFMTSDLGAFADGVIDPELIVGKFEQVEQILIASTERTYNRLINYRAEQAFDEIAKQLAAVSDQTESPKKMTRTKVNYLNDGFAGYIRFVESTEWTMFKKWFQDDIGVEGNWATSSANGFAILESSIPNTCAVLKLDDRTFLVGNKERLLKSIEAGRLENEQVSQWLDEMEEADFQGELYVAKSMNDSSGLGASFFFADSGPWKVIKEIAHFNLAIDLKSDSILDVDLRFTSDENATAFQGLIQKVVTSLTAETEAMINGRGVIDLNREKDSASNFYEWDFPTKTKVGKLVEISDLRRNNKNFTSPSC